MSEAGERMTTCSQCKVKVYPYAVFPADLCVECYVLTPEAEAEDGEE